MYEVHDGVELVVVQNEQGDIELVDDFLPEKFDNYGTLLSLSFILYLIIPLYFIFLETVMVDQREVQDDDIVPMDTWEVLVQNRINNCKIYIKSRN